ncbi:MAG: glycosyltransferase [Lachnospiraceae bacterium]|nr:glycosyltransferase [Lachnospiraceae bacterium]
MVSLIIPVYNTEEYLVKCIDSMLEQTYTDLEIIFINDGSTDNSLKILEEYRRRDHRIKIFSKENEGQGIARNIGVKKSTGEYIMFVDSDDWLDRECVELLMNGIVKYNADICIGNIYKTKINSEEIKENLEEMIADDFITDNKKSECLFDISTYPFSRIIKRSLFIDFDIGFPKHFFEDISTLPVIYAMANTISFVNRALYVYRMHGSSTVNNLEHVRDRIVCLDTLIDNFKKRGIYDQYAFQIKEYLKKRSMINRRVVREVAENNVCFFEEMQDEYDKKMEIDVHVDSPSVFVWGSYNLMIVAKIILNMEAAATVSQYYGGQSIISAVNTDNDKLNSIKVTHSNPFRRKSLVQDFSKKFMNLNPGEFCDNSYILVDLMEERYSIGVYGNDYFTISEAFDDVSDKIGITYEEILAPTEKWMELWKESCQIFVERLKQYVNPEHIVLVKMKLAETHKGETAQYFEDVMEIRKCNQRLDNCYNYFSEICDGAKIIEVENMDNYVTSSEFRHGCYPWHLNNAVYHDIANMIKTKLFL